MINLPNGYVMDADAYQYVVGKPVKHINKNTGIVEEIVISQPTYYATIEKALNGVLNRLKRAKVKECQGDLKDAINACNEVTRTFMEDLKQMLGDKSKDEWVLHDFASKIEVTKEE